MNTNNTKNEAMAQENEGSNNGNIANTFMALHMSALSFLQERSLNLLNNTQTGEGQTTKRKPLLTLINMKNQTKKQILTSCLIALSSLFLASGAFAVDKVTNGSSTNWNSSGTWTPNGVPTSSDNVTINHSISVNTSSAVANNVIINSGKTLSFTTSNDRGLTTAGTIYNSGTISFSSSSNIRTIVCGGVFTNNGTVTLSASNQTITANVDFINESAGTFTASSAVINISGDFTNNGTFTCGTSTINFKGVNKSFNGSSPLTLYNLTLTRQNSYTNSTDLTVVNTLTNSSTSGGSNSTLIQNVGSKLTISGTINTLVTLNVSSNVPNTVKYNSASQAVRSLTYSNLEISGSSQAAPSNTILGNLTGNFILSNGASFTTSSNLTLAKGLVIESGSSFIMGSSNTLTLKGDLTNNGTFTANSANLTFSGTTAQAISGTSGNNLNILLLNNSAGLTLNSKVNIYKTLTVTSGILNANGNLTLKSIGASSDSTAAVTVLSNPGTSATPGSTRIIGNVTVERFIPAGIRSHRFLSSAVNSVNIFDNWQEGGSRTVGYGIQITGTSANAAVAPAGLVNTTTGIDYSPLYGNSLLTLTNGTSFTQVTNTKTTNFTPGLGYSTFIRGDRTNDLYSNSVPTTNTSTTIRATGPLNQGDYTVNLASGWNLVGNPYASQLDWKASSWSGDRALNGNIDEAIYCLNPDAAIGTTNRFGCYVGNIGTNGWKSTGAHLASGQGFYVHTTAATTLTFKESYKTTNTAIGYFKNNSVADLLRVEYIYNGIHQDDIAINFANEGKANYDRSVDAETMGSATFGLASLKGNKRLAISTKPVFESVDTVALSVMANVTGKFTLKFTAMESFGGMTQIILIDKFLNKMISLDQALSYTFDITADPNSKGNNRFAILFSKVGTAAFTTGLANSKEEVSNVSLYPNPATSVINLTCSNANVKDFSYEIYNQMGQSVNTGAGNFTNGNVEAVNIENLDKGIYFVKMFYNNNAEIIRFVK